MIALKNNETEFRLEITGYEFPSIPDGWDANWLIVKINARDAEKAIDIEKCDSCILTQEIVNLYKWFSKISENEVEKDTIEFMEADFAFSYRERRLDVYLRYFLDPMEKQEEIYKASFEMNHDTLQVLLQEIEKVIQKFPGR